jgi:hypothetical protein
VAGLNDRKTEDQAEVAGEILRYFLRNPLAADSLEGITRWRLLDERIHRKLEETERALSALVERGLLIAEESPGLAGRVFRLDPAKLKEAEAYLEQAEKSEEKEENSSSGKVKS